MKSGGLKIINKEIGFNIVHLFFAFAFFLPMSEKAFADSCSSVTQDCDAHIAQGLAAESGGFWWTSTDATGDGNSLNCYSWSPDTLYIGSDGKGYTSDPGDCSVAEGSSEGSAEGSSEGSAEGSSEGSAEGSSEGSAEGSGSGGTYSVTLTVEPDTNGDLNGNFDSDLDDAVFSKIDSLTIDSGLSETFQVNAASGYIIQEVVSGDTTNCPLSVLSGGTNAIRTYTISNVNASCTITARFLINISTPGAWRGATSMITGSSSSFDTKEVRPNIILQMDDSFLMNSEVQWTAAAISSLGKQVFEDLSKVGSEMFINPRASQSVNNVYGKGAGYEALSSDYNALAFNPDIDYYPWSGIDPTTGSAYANRHFVCYYRQSSDSSNTAEENMYCPKYFVGFDNTLQGQDCSQLNSDSATTNSKYCVLRDCMAGAAQDSNIHGCKEFVPIHPTTTYSELGQIVDVIGTSNCTYTYPWQMSPYGPCLSWEAWQHFFPQFPSGTAYATSHCPGCTLSDLASCHTNTLTSGFCHDIKNMTFPAGQIDPGTGLPTGTIVTYNPFTYTCAVLNSQGQAICNTGLVNRPYTNILRKYDLLTHRYTVNQSGTLVTKLVSMQSEEIQQRYANWFTYYRTRGHVQKAALLRFIYASTEERIGLSSNQNIAYDPTSQWIYSSSASGNILDPASMSIAGNKAAMQEAIAKANYPFKTAGDTLENLIVNGTDKSSKYFKDNEAYQYKDFSDPSNLDEDDTTKNCRQNNVVVFTSSRWSDNSLPSTATSAAGSGGKATTYASLSNVANNYYNLDMFSQLDDYVPVTGTYSTNTGQHVKLWIAYMGPKGSNDETSQYLNPSYVNPAPGLTTYDAFIDDMAQAAVTGKGGFYRAMTLCDAVNLFSFPGANNDMLDWINANNQADYEACQAGSNDPEPAVRGMRISWKELKRH